MKKFKFLTLLIIANLTINIKMSAQKINNEIENYKTTITRRLLYLNEQAKIARTLNVAKNNILESQSFKTDTAVITTLISEIPYYMRGYEMIEKEIELIKKRKNTKAFVENLEELEIEMRSLTSNKNIKRLESLFKETPILKSDNFYAAKIMFQSTIHENLNERNQIKTFFLNQNLHHCIIFLELSLFHF